MELFLDVCICPAVAGTATAIVKNSDTLTDIVRIAGKAADFVKPVLKNAGDFVAKNLDNVLRNAGEAIGKGLSGIGGGLMALGTKGAKEGLEAVAEKAGKEIGEEVAEAAVEKASRNVDFFVGPEGNVASSLDDYDWHKNGSNIGNPVNVVGNGNTGRVLPNNLNEQMAMEQVLSSPLEGSKELGFKMQDSRWPGNEGWVKMENIVKNSDGSQSSIHFVYNKITSAFDDFKFK